MMREEITRELDVRPSSVALWFGNLAGPIAFLLNLQVKYSAVKYVCQNGASWILWGSAAIALVITIAGAAVTAPYWKSDDRRVQFMALGALTIDAMFALSIVAMSIPDIYIKACD